MNHYNSRVHYHQPKFMSRIMRLFSDIRNRYRYDPANARPATQKLGFIIKEREICPGPKA
jgi:hypothetical protein